MPPSSPLVIGLAGTIAAGKSTVASLLVERGAVHCDADKLVHTLYEPGTPAFDRIVAAFGAEVVGADGHIDRRVLGAQVFGNGRAMARLVRSIGIISESVKGVIDGWRAQHGPEGVCVMEAVSLMEPGYGLWCDQIWLIGVSDEIAVQRMIETRGHTTEEAAQRLSAQRPMEQRVGGADWIYLNDTTLDDLRTEVSGELDRIQALHRAGALPLSVYPPWWREYIPDHRERLHKSGVTIGDEL
jgi:dephospho-CoA kinase